MIPLEKYKALHPQDSHGLKGWSARDYQHTHKFDRKRKMKEKKQQVVFEIFLKNQISMNLYSKNTVRSEEPQAFLQWSCLQCLLYSLHSAFTSTAQEQAMYHVLFCLIVPALWNTRKLNERHYQTYFCVTNSRVWQNTAICYMWQMELWLKESQRRKIMPRDKGSKGTLINILNLDKGGVSSPSHGVRASPEEHTEGFSATGITRLGALKHIKPFRKRANWVSYLQGSHSRA